jgi:hypothetical protein
MGNVRKGFQLFIQNQGREKCTNDLQRTGYRMAEELYDKLVRASLLIDPRDLDSLLGMEGIDVPSLRN